MVATSKNKLVWIERMNLGQLELQDCGDKWQKEVSMDCKGELGTPGEQESIYYIFKHYIHYIKIHALYKYSI